MRLPWVTRNLGAKRLGLAALLLAGLVIPQAARADGDHNAPSRVIRVEVGDGRYDLWITLTPNPLLLAQRSAIKAQIIDRETGEAIRGGRVQMAIPDWMPPSLRQVSAVPGTAQQQLQDETEQERLVAIGNLWVKVRAAANIGQVLPTVATEVAPGVYALEFTPLAAEPYDLQVTFLGPVDRLLPDRPPVTVSLPLKILLFVLVDGWNLVVRSIVLSFGG